MDYELVKSDNETLKKEVKKSANSSSEDKRVTFGASEVREITPRQTQEISFPDVAERHSNESDSDALESSLHRAPEFEDAESGQKVNRKPVERVHKIKLSGRPDPEGRSLLAKVGVGAVPATYHYTSRRINDEVLAPQGLRSSSYDDVYSEVRKSRPVLRGEKPETQWNGHESVSVIPKAERRICPEVRRHKYSNKYTVNRRYMSRSVSPKLRGEGVLSAAPQHLKEVTFAAPELVESVVS